jgi:hypothetical protein
MALERREMEEASLLRMVRCEIDFTDKTELARGSVR